MAEKKKAVPSGKTVLKAEADVKKLERLIINGGSQTEAKALYEKVKDKVTVGMRENLKQRVSKMSKK